jgi:hypothetical protein
VKGGAQKEGGGYIWGIVEVGMLEESHMGNGLNPASAGWVDSDDVNR